MTTLFRIESDWLSLRCTQAGLDESRPLTAADESRFRGWLRDYHDSLRGYGDEPARLRLGRELYAWLDGDAGWLAHSRATALAPWIVDFRAPRDPDGLTRLFLQLPWELLADDRGYLAADLALRYAPVRRLGEPAQPEAPSPCRLSLVFMAAAPRDQRRLNYEAEETAILDATAKTGLDLTVEESGTLEWLAAHMAEEAPVDVLHLSCHGQGGTEPALCLETDEGATDLASVGRLIGELSTHRPRLLFLSAGNSARSVDARDGSGIVDSLALAVLREGMPAVLGWDGSVSDAEATEFAAHLYRQLSRKADLQAALAEARFALLNRIGADPLTRSRDWHLARLFLGPTGGGPLVKGDCARHRRGIEGGHKEFLDAKGQQIPVAGRLEFVGRRRLLQDALRELRQRNHAGVLIHGMARQGKSSLAARVANRLHHHGPVVVFEHYDAPAILEAFRRAVGGREVRDIIDAYRDRVRQHPDELADGLRELLEGPCRELVKDDGGRITSQPVLLVLDDLERILCDPGPGGLHRVQPEWVPVLRAVLEAFAKADSDSRLLMTSRFRFTLPQQDGRDLADALFALHLPPMETAESRQQAARKARPAGQAKAVPDEARTQRCIALAQGNPGLQDRLFSLSLQDPAACDQALTAMERYLAGQLPDQETVRAFLENLAIDHSLAVLKPGERELLRAATLFELPVPLAVLDVLAKTLALDAGEPCGIRLIGLGLWDVYPDMVRYSELAPAVNALVRPLAGTLTDGEIRALAGVALPELLAGWGGADGSRRPYPANYELARLAVRAGQPLGLEVTAEPAIRWLGDQLRYREAAQLARQAVACLDRHQIEIPLALLRVAGEACVQVGDTPTARSAYRRALARLGNLLSQGQTPDIESHAALLIAHSRLLVQDGYPNEALEFLEQTKQLLSADPRFQREHSIVLGDIARIMVSKGEVDAALQLHQDRLTVFQALGDQRERAVTLGDIARIMVSKGEVDAALQLHQDRLTVFQALGDQRERAVTLGDIARIMVSKGEVDAALQLHQDRLTVFQALGDQRERAVTLGDIARIMVSKGEVDAALQLHQDRLTVFQALGDQRERAVTLGDIARIMVSKGEVDAALQLHQDRLTVFQALGDQRERAVTLGDIARIMVSKGEVDAALQLHQEELTVYQVLGDPRSRAVTLGDIAWIKVSKGELNEAIKLHQEMLTVFQALGDQRSRAVTLGRIADVLQDRGELDEALRIRREEELPIYEQLGDVWSRAVTLGKITQLADSIGNSLTNEASEFFKQANFIVTPLSGNLGEFIVNGKNWATHINYGDILLKIIQGNLSGGHLRDLEAKLNSLRVSTTLAYVVFEGELLDEAFWQMVAYKLGKELTIIPLKAEFLHEALVAVKPDCFVKLRIVEQEYLGCGANRYEESNAIIDPTLFFGRQAEVGEILDRLKSGQHAGIFGMRKIGKTSLLLHLKQTVSCLSVPVAYLGLQSKMIDPFLLFRDVVQQLRSFLEKMGVSALPECGLLASQPVINTDRLFMEDIRALWEIARTELKVPFMLLMVDEADRIVPRSGSAISVYEKYDQFFAPIRELSQVEHCLLTVVTAERSTICEEFKQSPFPNTMFELYHERYLVSFSVAELENMITRIGKWMELEYSTESLRTIAEESACHPYVARSLCACIARNVKAGMVAVQEVVQAREDALDRLHQYFLGWWNNLAPEEQQIIHAVLTTQALPTDMTGSQQDAVRYLQKQQSITQTPTGWTITIGLLREWLNRRIGGNKENSGSAKSLQNDSAS